MLSKDLPELQQTQTILRNAYGERLKNIILFGSLARGQEDPDSDIDLMLLLDGPFDYWSELRYTVDLLAPLQLKSPRYISPKIARYADFMRGSTQLYKNIQHDGIVLG